ncbi:hypothetical protein B2G69_07645 [Methylorubrum zatmanii]|nr:hypothetical protein [Methylorubrum zatmanii]ARO54031.1 hypothetical protein B2G69_07645 [Methylorubrum zatmanii]
MRLLALALAAARAAAAEPRPAQGRYCAVGVDLPGISIGPGAAVGIDLMDCPSVRIAGGRVRAARCYSPGGAEVSYDTDLAVRPEGALEHDGAVYRPCR